MIIIAIGRCSGWIWRGLCVVRCSRSKIRTMWRRPEPWRQHQADFDAPFAAQHNGPDFGDPDAVDPERDFH